MDRWKFLKNAVIATAGVAAAARLLSAIITSNEKTNMDRTMKVTLICGSARRNGNTMIALDEVTKQLGKYQIETELIQIRPRPIRFCIGCYQCREKQLGRCVFDDDQCNEVIAALERNDAVIVGTPVYYGQPNGGVLALMQRAFFSCGKITENKPAAGVAVCRRGGATSALQSLNQMFQILNMPLITSQYWNIVYGSEKGEARLDTEGMQTMRTLADNIAWILRRIHLDGQPDYPKRTENWQGMNFIRK